MTQSLRRLVPLLDVALIILIVVAGSTTSAEADYNVKVAYGNIPVHISGNLAQAVPNSSANNTADSFASLPIFAVRLQGDNASLLSNYLNNALRVRSPSATASQITLYSNANGTLYHYDLSFNVTGVSVTRGDADTVDLSWRSFAIGDDIKAGNSSLNNVLPTYLLNRIAQFARLPQQTGPPTVVQRFWYWNNKIITSTAVASTVQNVGMFDFTGLSNPLQSWSVFPSSPGRSVQYRRDTGFNLTFIERAIEPEGNTNFARDVVYKLIATIDIPWNAFASNDSVVLEASGNLSTMLMIGLIALSVGLSAITVIIERHFQNPRKSIKSRRFKK